MAAPHATAEQIEHEDVVDHTGHGGHHVFSAKMLKTTFVILVGLTFLTVILAGFERGFLDLFGWNLALPEIPFGALSVPIALGIAGTKAYFVASNFMGLKHETGSNLLVFAGTLVFLVIFFGFTWLDFAFRGSFEELSAVPTDVLEEEAAEAAAIQAEIDAREAVPLVVEPDPVLFNDPGTYGDVQSVPDSPVADDAPGEGGAADGAADGAVGTTN